MTIDQLTQQAAEPGTLLFVGACALLAVVLGGLAGWITRNIILLVAVVGIVLAAIYFHHMLPLSGDLHRDVEGLRQTIFR